MRSTSYSESRWIRFLTTLRALIGIIYLVPHTAVLASLVALFGMIGRQRTAMQIVALWARALLFAFGVKVRFSGSENLQGLRASVLAYNHQSDFDILALMVSPVVGLRFGAKVELFRIPIFAQAMRACGCLPIARQDRDAVVKVYEQARKHFDQGIHFALAPEGTRQSEPRIGPFKKGPFFFAAEGRVPVLPVVIVGSLDVLPKTSFLPNVGQWSRTIHLRFGQPMPSPAVPTHDAVDGFRLQVRERIVAMYGELTSEVQMAVDSSPALSTR